MTIDSTGCCGLNELHQISYSTIKEIIEDVCESRYPNDDPCPFYLFTEVTHEKYGHELKKFIIKHNLGKVIKTTSRKNPNSGNMITAYIWEVNNKNFKSYCDKLGYDTADTSW